MLVLKFSAKRQRKCIIGEIMWIEWSCSSIVLWRISWILLPNLFGTSNALFYNKLIYWTIQSQYQEFLMICQIYRKTISTKYLCCKEMINRMLVVYKHQKNVWNKTSRATMDTSDCQQFRQIIFKQWKNG